MIGTMSYLLLLTIVLLYSTKVCCCYAKPDSVAFIVSSAILNRKCIGTPQSSLLIVKMSGLDDPTINRPNTRTYWVNDNLMAGEYPLGDDPIDESLSNDEVDNQARQRIQQYLQSGITYFIDLTRDGENPIYSTLLQEEANKLSISKVIHNQMSIQDEGISPIDSMKSIISTIDTAITNKHKVYVHCGGGIGRTGTVIGCYLANYNKNEYTTGTDAFNEVNRLFKFTDQSNDVPSSPANPKQIDFIKNWNIE